MKKCVKILMAGALMGMLLSPFHAIADVLPLNGQMEEAQLPLTADISKEQKESPPVDPLLSQEESLGLPTPNPEDEAIETAKEGPDPAVSAGKDSEVPVIQEPLQAPGEGTEAPKAKIPPAKEIFSVSKYPTGNPGEETAVGSYNNLYDALTVCKDYDANNQYVVTMNADYEVPETEYVWSKQGVNILLRSAQGNQYTLKRKGSRNICYLDSKATLRTENIILDGNDDGEAFMLAGASTLTLGRGTVFQNFRDDPATEGSAFYLYEDSNAILNIEDGVLIQDNKGGNSQVGVIDARKGTTVNISGGTFKNNSSSHNGGVLISNGILNITAGTFEGNSSDRNAGALWIGRKCTAKIENAVFTSNKSTNGAGGAIYAANDITVKNCTFTKNEARMGGGICAFSKATVEACTFTSNKASTGGAVYPQGDFTATDVSFKNNAANYGGAFIVYQGKKAELSKATFTENTASNYGGAIYGYSNGAQLSLTDSTFTKNKADLSNGSGGAIFMASDGNITADSTTFTENQADLGGAIRLRESAKDSRVTNCIFTSNQAMSQGGGIFSSGTMTVEKSNFENNGSKDTIYGGALCFNGSHTFAVKDSIIKENEARLGAGIFDMGGTLTVEGTTLEGNVAEPVDNNGTYEKGVGGAILSVKDTQNNATSKMTLKDCKIKNNKARNAAGVLVEIGEADIQATEFSGNDTAGSKDEQAERAGGGLYIGKEAKVTIGGNSKFIGNTSGWGGAIFDDSCDYQDPTGTDMYRNLTIDKTTLFTGNSARNGLYQPPRNFAQFTNLAFSDESDIPHDAHMHKSLLNNYDINYQNDLLITYDANGGTFAGGALLKQELHKINDTIILSAAPSRTGYQFLYWTSPEYQVGAAYTVTENHTFVAQWNKPPELEVKNAEITEGDTLDLVSLITKARDEEDGEKLEGKVVIDKASFDHMKAGVYEISYTLTDKEGASVTKNATVTVTKKADTHKPNGKASTPNTGDGGPVLSLLGFVLAATTGLCLLVHRRKRANENV